VLRDINVEPVVTDHQKTIHRLEANLEQVIRGKTEALRLLITAFLGRGHILIEDVPGVGKTTLANAVARTINGVFKRIQFTPDLLPSDIVGTNILNPKNATFDFIKGPIFANILLADEINRTSPRTQSSLLEGMNENQVTVDGVKYPLPELFCVIATQNPIEYHGTYPLPEAQMDRFAMQIEMGYPDGETEIDILKDEPGGKILKDLQSQASVEEILVIQELIDQVKVGESVLRYLLAIVNRTRNHSSLKLGISPRGALIFKHMAQAYSYVCGRDYVIPDDIKKLLLPVCAHRIILDTKSKYSGINRRNLLLDLMEEVPVPV